MRILGQIVIAILAALMIVTGVNGGTDIQLGFGFLLVGMFFILHQMPDRPEQEAPPVRRTKPVDGNTINISD